MFGWLRPDPKRRLQRAYEAKLREAHHAMNTLADRGLHAERMAEARELERQLEELTS